MSHVMTGVVLRNALFGVVIECGYTKSATASLGNSIWLGHYGVCLIDCNVVMCPMTLHRNLSKECTQQNTEKGKMGTNGEQASKVG